ncbi:MAG: hypothetical protein ABJL64_20115 [Rhizobiaceae bacterium]
MASEKKEGTAGDVMTSALVKEIARVIAARVVWIILMIGLLVLAGIWFFAKPYVDDYIRKVAGKLPPGAIVITDRELGCPPPWTNIGKDQHQRFAGRTIIVAGPPGERDDKKHDTINRSFDDQGGSENVGLDITTLPDHVHNIQHGEGKIIHVLETASGSTIEIELKQLMVPNTQLSRDSQEDVGNEHENMPPFIALHFCQVPVSNKP